MASVRRSSLKEPLPEPPDTAFAASQTGRSRVSEAGQKSM